MMGRPLNRVTPVGPIQAYKTYSVRAPQSTHWRPATCEEVDCEAFLHGWVTALKTHQEDLIDQVKRSGRAWSSLAADPFTTTFVFPPGTKCFAARSHRIQVRPEIYVVRAGDWRGNPSG